MELPYRQSQECRPVVAHHVVTTPTGLPIVYLVTAAGMGARTSLSRGSPSRINSCCENSCRQYIHGPGHSRCRRHLVQPRREAPHRSPAQRCSAWCDHGAATKDRVDQPCTCASVGSPDRCSIPRAMRITLARLGACTVSTVFGLRLNSAAISDLVLPRVINSKDFSPAAIRWRAVCGYPPGRHRPPAGAPLPRPPTVRANASPALTARL